jgi:hypothetical protein
LYQLLPECCETCRQEALDKWDKEVIDTKEAGIYQKVIDEFSK